MSEKNLACNQNEDSPPEYQDEANQGDDEETGKVRKKRSTYDCPIDLDANVRRTRNKDSKMSDCGGQPNTLEFNEKDLTCGKTDKKKCTTTKTRTKRSVLDAPEETDANGIPLSHLDN
ncbi:hypothetical protein Trydic_g17719 [Trypoxylus dichotomus]